MYWNRSRARRYGVALLATAAALLLWLLFKRSLEPSPFLLLCAAIALSTWYGGFGPGLVAVGLGCLVSLVLYLPPAESLTLDSEQAVIHLVLFALVALLLTSLQGSLQRSERSLASQALHDPLTGLANRALFQDRLEQALAHASRQQESLALLFLDLDGFKQVNDSLGHAAGDLLLQQLGTRLTHTLRAADTVARLGGDEFAMILPGTEEEGAGLAVQKVLEAIRQPFRLEAERAAIRGSVGVALYPQHGSTSAALLQRADAAMYRGKQAGTGDTLAAPSPPSLKSKVS